MAERASVLEVVQLGVEVTEGTGVVATKRLQSLLWQIAPAIDVKTMRGSGYKIGSLAALGKESTTGKISGAATYTEIIYLLNSALKHVTAAAGGATSKVWTFTPSATTVETHDAFTVEWGSSVRAERAAGHVVDSFGLKVTRDEVTIDASSIGRALEDNHALTGLTSADEIEIVPILPTQCDVYLDTTWAGAGTTKLTRCLEADIAYSGIWGEVWAVNSAISGPSASVQLPIDATAKLVVERDAAGMGPLANLRAGSAAFLCLKAVGPQIDAAPLHTYALTVTACVRVTDYAEGEQDGVGTAEWTYAIQNDPTSGNHLSVVVENKLAAL